MRKFLTYLCSLLQLLVISCSDDDKQVVLPGYIESDEHFTLFTNVVATYNGRVDDSYDSWLVKLYTDMSTDLAGNPIGPGSYVQFLIKTPCNELEVGEAEYLTGHYTVQTESDPLALRTFQSGYMELIEIAGGKAERPYATFYADLRSGSINMQVDLVSEGEFSIVDDGNGTYTIQGCLIGEKCIKRNFLWQGKIRPQDKTEQTRPNSTLHGNLLLDNLYQGAIHDLGYEYRGVEVVAKRVLLYTASMGITFENGEPLGSGDVMRFEMLVSPDWDVSKTLPVGRYEVIERDESGSFDPAELKPFVLLAGLQNAFYYPELSGTWYIKYTDDEWSDSYALVDGGLMELQPRYGGSYNVYCDLTDCAEPENIILTKFDLDKDYITFYTKESNE